jgi:hypothetical protein
MGDRPWWLALAPLLLLAPPAHALDLGRPFGLVGLDLAYEDHVTGTAAPDPSLYPKGNIDSNGGLNLGVGDQIAIGSDRQLTVSGRLRGYRYVNYPDFSGVGGTVATELAAYHLVGLTDLFWSLSGSSTYGSGNSGSMDLTLEHPIALEVIGSLDSGAYRFVGSGADHVGYWGEAALRRAFGPVTLSLSYSYIHRGYDSGQIDQLQVASAYLNWKVWGSLYLKGSAEHDWTVSTDSTRTFDETLLNLGTLYYQF